MIRYDLFRALNPDDKYPHTPFDVKLNSLRYDLPLPPPVGDVLLDLLSPKGPFRRLHGRCTPAGIEILRTSPDAFESERGVPSYAESEVVVEATPGRLVMGYVLHQVAASAATASEIARRAAEGGFSDVAAAEWITQNCIFFQHCGGFELACVPYYFNTDEKDVVFSFVDGAVCRTEPKARAEQPSRFGMFREMLDSIGAEAK